MAGDVVAPHGLLGDRIPGRDAFALGTVLYDIANEHSKVIDGAVLEAVAAIDGNLPDSAMLKAHLSRYDHDSSGPCLSVIYWRGEAILEIHKPEITERKGSRLVNQKIKCLWKQRRTTHAHLKG
jgi:hypothetical protein